MKLSLHDIDYYWRTTLTEEECRHVENAVPGLKVNSKTHEAFGMLDAFQAQAVRWGESPPTGPFDFILDLDLPSEDMEGLHAYQIEAVKWLFKNAKRGAILADDMGLGKTATSLVAARLLTRPERSTRVVCPASVIHQWREEAKRWAPDTNVEIRSYQKATEAWIAEAQVLIVDEAHALKKRHGHFFKTLGYAIRKVPNRILLTGTPVDDRVRDLWGLLNLLRYGAFGSYSEFSRAYCGGHPGNFGWEDADVEPSPELRERLKSWVLRRSYMEVANVMGVKKLREKIVCKPDETPAETAARNAWHFPGPCVVFTRKRATAGAIHNWLSDHAPFLKVYRLTGEIQPDRRAALLRHARHDVEAGQKVVVVCTIAACGTGLNMDWARIGIFAELDWRPSQILQAEMRLFRLAGNAHDCMYYFIVPANGAYDRAISILIEKLDHIERALGQDPNASSLRHMFAGMDDASRSELLAMLSAQEAVDLGVLDTTADE